MSAPDTRLVPAGRELRDQLADLLRYLHPDSREPIKSFVAAWDAAPADPAEAVWAALRRHDYTTDINVLRDAVLTALNRTNGGQT